MGKKAAPPEVKQQFSAALDALVEQVKQDRSVLAADPLRQPVARHGVGEVRHRPGAGDHRRQEGRQRVSLALYADGVNVHALLMPRAEFRKTVEGSMRNSFMHSLPGQGTSALHARRDHRRTCARSCTTIGERDTQVQLLAAATHALAVIYKAHKWFVTRGDLDYTALWILYAATALARIEVIGGAPAGRPRGDPAGDEAEPRVLQDGLHRPAQRQEDARRTCEAALDAIDGYLAERAPALFAPVLDHLREVGEARSAPKSRTTSSATSTSVGSPRRASTWPTRD